MITINWCTKGNNLGNIFTNDKKTKMISICKRKNYVVKKHIKRRSLLWFCHDRCVEYLIAVMISTIVHRFHAFDAL